MTVVTKIDCIAIPDGFVGDEKTLCLSLVLSPRPTSAGDGFDLLEWPNRVQQLAFEVQFGSAVADLAPLANRPRPDFGPQGKEQAIADKATAWWKKVWDNPLVLAGYAEVLTRDAGAEPAEIQFYHQGLLVQIAKSKLASDLEFELLASELRGKPKEIAALGLPPSIKRQVERPHDPASRYASALDLIERETFGDLPIGDASATVFAANTPNALSPGLGGGPLTRQLMNRLRRDFEETRKAVLADNDDGFDLGAFIGQERPSWDPPAIAEAAAPSALLAPFVPDRRDARYDPDVFGEPLDPPIPTDFSSDSVQQAESAQKLTDARVGIARFDYAIMPDAKRGEPLKRLADWTPAEEALNTAERHAAALQAHPALRKFVRMIVDIRVPLADVPEALRSAGKGVVAVKVTGLGAPARASATAFVLKAGAAAETSIFEPCPQAAFGGTVNAAKVPSLPLDTGVVMLNIGTNGKPIEPGDEDTLRRFSLETVDGIAAMSALRQEIKSAIRGYRVGVSLDKPAKSGSALRTRGLMLLDSQAYVPEIIAQERAKALANSQDTHLFFAEDLVDGYRPDAVRTDDAVFPLAARAVSYETLNAVVTELGLPATSFAGIGEREHGYVLSSTRKTSETIEEEAADGTKTQKRQVNQTTSDHLFCWTGNNLGLPTPAPSDPYPPEEKKPEELPEVIKYEFVKGVKGAILRVGGRYRYMLRARKLNGSSVSPAVAKAMVSRHALGDGKGGSYTYMPVEPPPPPTVLVPQSSVLTPPAAGEDGGTSAGQTIIVNTGETAIRFLVSPKIEFDLAEQQGQFDVQRGPGETEDQASKRAFNRRWSGVYPTLRRDGRCGAFPIRKAPPDRAAEARVQQFELLAKPNLKPNHPYFVDASLCTLGSELIPINATTSLNIDDPVIEEETSFWARSAADRASKQQGFAPEKVRPILLEVFATTAKKSRIVQRKARTVPVEDKTISVSVLRVEVAPGDTFSLETWANRLAVHAIEQPVVRAALAKFESRLTRKGVGLPKLAGIATQGIEARESAWEQVTSGRLHPTLVKSTAFRIEHAVRLPLAPPDFQPTVAIGATRRLSDDDWASVAASPQGKSVVNAEVAYAWGKITFDRKTTRRVWAEVIWPETDPAILCTRTSTREDRNEIDPTGLWAYNEKAFGEGRLFDIDQIPAIEAKPGESEESYKARADVLDLVHVDGYEKGKSDEKTSLRNLTADFKTDKARRLLVRLVAASRFLPPSASLTNPDNVVASASRKKFTDALWIEPKEPGQPPDLPTGVKEFWLKATRPPPPPRLMKDEGTLYERRLDDVTDGLPSGHRGLKLTHVYRCWLDRDWFASGEGELLAVLCRHPGGGTSPWVLDQVSRWGSDMTMQPAIPLSPAPTTTGDTTFLDERQIIRRGPQIPGVNVSQGSLPMPTSRYQVEAEGSADRNSPSRTVAFALLKPQFHTGVGRWYCDIEIEPASAFRVHLKLSLARFQPNAIAGCELSQAVKADAFLLHQPWTFSVKRDDRRITVTATGPTYISRAPMTMDLKGRTDEIAIDRANRPLIVAELERTGDGSEGPLPVVDARRLPVRTDNRAVKEEPGWPTQKPGIPVGCSRWTMQLDIPGDDVERRHAVRISLLTAHANSEAATDLSQDGPLIHLPEPLVVQLVV